jgi:hypothetical protein
LRSFDNGTGGSRDALRSLGIRRLSFVLASFLVGLKFLRFFAADKVTLFSRMVRLQQDDWPPKDAFLVSIGVIEVMNDMHVSR